MKKLIFFVLISFMVTVSVNAQTSQKELIQKINNAPANQYGVKRINYGTWQTKDGQENIWAYYDSKEKSYKLCVATVGQSTFKNFVTITDTTDSNKETENICKKLNPRKWVPVQWPQ